MIFGDRLEIDFGLARARDAIEQRDMKAAARGQRAHRIDSRALLAREFRLREGRIRRRRRSWRRQRLDRQRALIDQAIDHARADAGLPGRLRLAMQQAVGEYLDQAPPRRRHPPRRLARQPHAHAQPLGPEIFAHPQGHAQHHAAGGQRVVGDPVDERAQFRFQRRDVELFGDVLQTVMQPRIGLCVLRPHHSHHFARAERHADDVAGRQAPCRAAPGRNRSDRAQPAPAHRPRRSMLRMRRGCAWCGPLRRIKAGDCRTQATAAAAS